MSIKKKKTNNNTNSIAQTTINGKSQQATKRKPARVIHSYRDPVTRVTTKTKYMIVKRYTDKFGQIGRALTTAHNKYNQTLLQLLKLNRVVGIHLDLSESTGNDESKYNSLYNELFALEIEIKELEENISLLGKVTDILEPLDEAPKASPDIEEINP
jgi:hypothetical protein